MMESDSTRLVVDTGPDFRMQMLREGVTKLDGVIYTHEHKDHLAGMDDVRPFNYMQKTTMPLHASVRVEEALRRDFHYAFEEGRHGGVPNVAVTHGNRPIHGFVAGDLAYITDASALPASTMARLQGVEVLVLNALRPEPHYSHFNLEQALEVAVQVGAKQTWFTHLSHLMGTHASREASLPVGVRLAHDGLVLTHEGERWVTSTSAWLNTKRS
jgi:phosphoribosyl 1,2-cyclic phosphate phosphodiesterase